MSTVVLQSDNIVFFKGCAVGVRVEDLFNTLVRTLVLRGELG
jgi:hypothetical protein